MGTTRTSVLVQPVADGGRSWRGLFLVDSGATFSLVPARILRELGVTPHRSEVCEMADGSSIELGIGGAVLTVHGVAVTGEVLFGPDDAEPLLGALTMQSANLIWDARRERLVASGRPHLLKSARSYATALGTTPTRSATAPVA